MLRSFAAPQPQAVSTPVGCRRHPLSGELAAIEAAPPLIVQLFEIVVVVFVEGVVIVGDEWRVSQYAGVSLHIVELLL